MIGQINKRGESWTVRIFLGRDANGKRKYFNKTIHGTKKDAQKYLTAKLREKDLGVFIEPASMSLNEYLDKWLNESAKPRLAESTFESYRYLSNLYIRGQLGNRKLSDIKPFDVQKLYNSMSEQGLTARTVRYVHAILTSAFSQAIKWQMLVVNPCNAVILPKLQKNEMKAFSPEEAKRFLEFAKDDKHGLIFAFALASGMRPSEYLALKWTDIDFVKHTATVQRVLTWRKGGGWYFAEPKTAKSRRTLPIPEHLFVELKRYKRVQAEAMLKLDQSYERNNFVFATDEGKPIYLRNLRKRNFQVILEKADLKGFRLYDLRHSMATLLLSEGINPKIVSERLGHASIVLTLDIYSHVLPTMQIDATAKLGQLLFG
ncbi:MAG: site-specific integrase [Acidobacteriota bacterium]|nr:site-specific integrase [Acidobacteriota bacterium]